MERQEIEAELNEVERDLAYIARRAHIAASNLRSLAVAVKCGQEALLEASGEQSSKKVAGERHWKVKIEHLNTSIHYFNIKADSKKEAEDKAYERLSRLLTTLKTQWIGSER